MIKELGKDIEPIKRIAFLNDNCDSVEEKGYMKRISPEEIRSMKDELSEASIEINEIEEAKREAAKVFKAQMDPLKIQRNHRTINQHT